jgi:hypothetical protein
VSLRVIRSSIFEVIVEFNTSASAILIPPSSPIILAVLSENEMKPTRMLLLRSSEVRVEFDLSASDNLTAPLKPIQLSVLSENEMKQQVCYC